MSEPTQCMKYMEPMCECCLDTYSLRRRAEAAEAALQRVRAVIRICDFEVDPASDGESLGESVVVVPVHNLLLALDGHE